ncbi:MAG: M48 family metallopeptidase [Candidatus Pacebacteria bacterium]|jgi:heat shock protein HtpX|nr:M48 family metallopeptidase [Candidatus Paceibacterota bacterium]
MSSLYTHQSKNIRKTWIIFTLFLVVVISVCYVFARTYDNPSILYFGVIFSLLMNVIGYWYSDKVVLSMSGARPVARETNRELYTLVENLAITAGLPLPKIYIIDDPAPNAFATGRDKNHAVVAVTTGLLERLDRTELEGVVAHELSHIGNRDMLLSTVVVVLVGFLTIASDVFLRAALWGGGRDREENKVGSFFMVAGIVLAILSPVIATLMQLAISRKREYLADASAALLTRYPEGLASALEKISQYKAPMRRVSNATAHLFISDPFGKKFSAVHKLFMTHPPTADRIKVLRGMK